MPFEVRMPRLGMNQDSAVIVAWLKAEGERVATGEPLLEVETDKATMEVEAATDGWLAGIRAGEGADIPVGDLVAVIVQSEDDVAGHAGVSLEPAASGEGDAPAAEPARVTAPGPSAPESPAAAPAAGTAPPAEPAATKTAPPNAMPPSGSRVLASPRARRLASERGIDLALLRAQGVSEPIHAADLVAAAAGGRSSLSARADAAALDALLARGEGADRTRLFAAFASGAWRALFAADGLAVTLRGIDGSLAVLPNPDRGGAGGAPAAPLSVVDLCDTRLSSYAPAGGGATLSVARDGDAFRLTLAFSEGALPMPRAVALLDDIAARVENPIRQLL